MTPIGADLIAQCKIGRRGNPIFNGKKWPQRADEVKRIGEFVVAEGVRSYLEIGLHCGFTFRYLGGLLPIGSRMVGVDLGLPRWGPDLLEAEQTLSDFGQEVHVLIGDSTSPDIIQKAMELGPYDLVFIDGDHSAKGVLSDWDNYGPLGRIVAFHDIDAASYSDNFAVHKLWGELKSQYRSEEIIGRNWGEGIGVLWRA